MTVDVVWNNQNSERMEIYDYNNKESFKMFQAETENNEELLKCFYDKTEDFNTSSNRWLSVVNKKR